MDSSDEEVLVGGTEGPAVGEGEEDEDEGGTEAGDSSIASRTAAEV